MFLLSQCSVPSGVNNLVKKQRDNENRKGVEEMKQKYLEIFESLQQCE